VIAYGSMFGLMLWREHRVFPVPYPWRRIARVPVILALALAATYLLPDSGTGALVLRVLIALAIPVGYIAIGFLTRAELARAKAIVAGLRTRGGSAPPGDTAEPEPDEEL
jgi:hypothetical protein